MNLQSSGGCLPTPLTYNDQSMLWYAEAHRRWFVRGWLAQNSRVHNVSYVLEYLEPANRYVGEEVAKRNAHLKDEDKHAGSMNERLVHICSGRPNSLAVGDGSTSSFRSACMGVVTLEEVLEYNQQEFLST